MASFNDFINCRWSDAKEMVRNLDPDYLSKVESVDASVAPKQRLSKKWHHLLEACFELHMEANRVRFTSENLRARAHKTSPIIESGRITDFCIRSWFIHALALAERTDGLIDKTVGVYVSCQSAGKEISKRHKQMVEEQVGRWVRKQRNDYVHPNRSITAGITEDQHWELSTAAGPSTLNVAERSLFQNRGVRVKQGEFNFFDDWTTMVIERLGTILNDFEKDLANYSTPRCRME